MSWRIADALLVLRAEVDSRFPGRDRASDGSIGDAAHASRTSDHNPWVIDADGVGVVRAIDVDAGPGYLPDEEHDTVGDWTAETARIAGKRGHPALRDGGYVIAEGRIASEATDWEWVPYDGANDHETHTHISVGRSPAAYDSLARWTAAPAPIPQEDPVTPEEMTAIVSRTVAGVEGLFTRPGSPVRTALLGLGRRAVNSVLATFDSRDAEQVARNDTEQIGVGAPARAGVDSIVEGSAAVAALATRLSGLELAHAGLARQVTDLDAARSADAVATREALGRIEAAVLPASTG